MAKKSLFDFLWGLGIENLFLKENGKTYEVLIGDATEEQIYSFAKNLPKHKTLTEEQETEWRSLVLEYETGGVLEG